MSKYSLFLSLLLLFDFKFVKKPFYLKFNVVLEVVKNASKKPLRFVSPTNNL